MNDINKYSERYNALQMDRISKSIQSISSRDAIVSKGNVVPQSGKLPIGTGKRFKAATMFIDICGFSNRPSDTEYDQSNNLRVITFFFSELIRIIEDYGGTIEKNTGDGLMAYFPDVNSSENTKQKAISCALTIFYTAENILNPVIISSQLQKIDFRVAINYGSITVAEVGSAQRFRGIVAIGSSANVANKMLSFADENELLLGEFMLGDLPADWLKFIKLKVTNTGWLYNGLPYKFYKYDGRWSKPI